jgi:hypothetical protein
MPRIPRAQQAGFVYHVINRGNGRATIFHKAQDCQAFLSILALVKARHAVKMFAFSLMPNQFHFLIEASYPCPVEVEKDWLAYVDEPLSASRLASIRQPVNRQRPFGEPDWQTTIAGLFGLESTMRPRGRPALNETRSR